MKYVAIILAVLALNAHAIDSLLKAAEKQEKKRVKEAKKNAQAIIHLTSGEKIACKWLAREGDVFRYERADDGKLFTTPVKDVARVIGDVLDKTPDTEVVVHAMYCDGRACHPNVKTIRIPVWPTKN